MIITQNIPTLTYKPTNVFSIIKVRTYAYLNIRTNLLKIDILTWHQIVLRHMYKIN